MGPDLRFGACKELESDPALFTLLVEEFGCNEVEVEEVYDLDSLETLSADSFGLIFLFKWANSIAQNSRSFGSRRNRASRNPESSPDENSTASDENGNVTLFDAAISQRLFFAHQVVPNSCASHALLSVLLNCSDRLNLGAWLLEMKEKLCRIEDPELRGFAIGNMPEFIAKHNRFACFEPPSISDLAGATTTSLGQGETFHYCCYIPYEDSLYELDGLKAWPINHGQTGGQWLEKAKNVISLRISRAREKDQGCHDIRYNLMSVVPSRKLRIRKQIVEQRGELTNKLRVLNRLAISVAERDATFEEVDKARKSVRKALEIGEDKELNGVENVKQESLPQNVEEFCSLVKTSCQEFEELRIKFEEEDEKHLRYERDAERRSHDYGLFIQKFIEFLHRNGSLQHVIDESQTKAMLSSRMRKKPKSFS